MGVDVTVFERFRDGLKKAMSVPDQPRYDGGNDEPVFDQNTPDLCSICGHQLEVPPTFGGRNTGPLATAVCIMCDRKPKGVW